MANSITKITNTCFRVLLDPIIADASVTIGFDDKTVPADLSMQAPTWEPYHLPDGQAVSLIQAVQVDPPVPTTDVTAAVPISIAKTGTTHADFVITVHNDNAAEGTTSAALELYISWGGH